MRLTGTILLFWAAGLTAHIILLAVLVARDRAKTFPVFTTLIAVNVINALALLEIARYGSKHTYFIAYFAFAVLDFILQLWVTWELAEHIFRPTGTWAPDVKKGFIILLASSVPIAAILACLPTPPEKTLLGTLLDRGNLFTSALQCELLVGMIAFSTTAALPWKTHVARIAQGLGFYSFIGILTEAGHSILVRNSDASVVLTFTRMSAYLACASWWIVMVWMNAPAPAELPDAMRRQLFTLQTRVEYDLRKLRALRR